MLPRLTLPPPPAALAVLAAAFILPGLVFHDLWKTQDAIGLGIVHSMAVSGDLVVPSVAGIPWLQDQPLYHWVALLFGTLLGWMIEFHAAARLASGAFVAAAFVFIYSAEREWTTDDPDVRRTAAGAAFLVLMGCVGLLVHAHEALPELASLAAMCAALTALPYATRRPVHAGVAFGVALGVAFLSASWTAPAGLALAVIAAHLAVPEWRTRGGATFLVTALVLALLLASAWPLAIALRSGDLFLDWWDIAAQRDGRFGENVRHFFSTASWFTWPAWPLALWSAWSLRRRWRELRLFVPGAAVLAIAALHIVWGPPQDENLIPMLAPLSLLAAHGVFTLRRGAVAALDWFGVLTFAVFTGLVWLGYIAMLTGLPAPVARNFSRIAPGFVAQLQPLAMLVALVLVVAWLYLIFFTPFSPMRSVARWAGGMVLLWGTFAMLWMPWVDYQKSYRSVALALKAKIPLKSACIAQRGLGVSQAAALDYHGGIRTQPFDAAKPAACPLVLVQGTPQTEREPQASTARAVQWAKLADVGRPGDRAERYRLYRLKR
jgi:4-amino-4-deoxy-L-arabinose transferase-like glycosyltransferase